MRRFSLLVTTSYVDHWCMQQRTEAKKCRLSTYERGSEILVCT